MNSYTVGIKEAENLFGLRESAIRSLIQNGTLCRGRHYLKPTGKKILIKVNAFVHWMHEADGMAPGINEEEIQF